MPRIIQGSWLDEYMHYTRNQESPALFHKWCGISAVGAALERHISIDMGEEGEKGAYQVRPNLFIILVADPALCKKSTAIDMMSDLLIEMEEPVNIFAQKITTEALISRMAATMKMEGEEVVHNSACMVIASELGVFLGSDAYTKGLVGVLIELYDCKNVFKYETKARGTEVLRKTWIHLIGGTTPTWLKSGFPSESVGGGFTSRIIFVYSNKPRERNPFPSVDYQSKDKLIKDLDVISRLKGEVKWSKEGREWYRVWYKEQEVKRESMTLLGYSLRKAVNVVKIAMILSVCESDRLILEVKDLELALSVLDEVEVDMGHAVMSIEKSAKGSNLEHVYSIIKESGEISRVDLMRRMSYKHSAVELDEVLSTLLEAGMVKEYEVTSPNTSRGVRSKRMYSMVKEE